MSSKVNKTSVGSVIFLDIIDYSKKPTAEQFELKSTFNDILNNSLNDVSVEDRIIVDSGDGAAIAYMGSPEDMLMVASSIQDEIVNHNAIHPSQLKVRIGINLGPICVVNDINGQPNIIGDGINVAQRIMSFSKPNQILVSRSYYDVISKLTDEIARMFYYIGIKHDKHVRGHEVYAMRAESDTAMHAMARFIRRIIKNRASQYSLLSALSVVLFLQVMSLMTQYQNDEYEINRQSFMARLIHKQPPAKKITDKVNVATIKQSLEDDTEERALQLHDIELPPLPPLPELPNEQVVTNNDLNASLKPNETKVDLNPAPMSHKTNVKIRKPKQKPVGDSANVSDIVKAPAEEQSGWEVFKRSLAKGGTSPCSQAEHLLSQCSHSN